MKVALPSGPLWTVVVDLDVVDFVVWVLVVVEVAPPALSTPRVQLHGYGWQADASRFSG